MGLCPIRLAKAAIPTGYAAFSLFCHTLTPNKAFQTQLHTDPLLRLLFSGKEYFLYKSARLSNFHHSLLIEC